jgi:putative two-component system response regulator
LMESVLFIEDDSTDAEIIKTAVEKDGGYDYVFVNTIDEAIEQMKRTTFSLIVSDFKLMGETAFDVLEHIDELPVIIITGAGSENLAVDLMKKGVYDYIIKGSSRDYAERLVYSMKKAIEHHFAKQKLKDYKRDLEDAVKEKTRLLQETVDEHLKTLRQLRKSERKMNAMLRNSVDAISNMTEAKDPYTAGHQRRVASLAREISKKMGMTKDQILHVYIASLLHDVGKIKIPSEILSKPGKLTPQEFELIKIHPVVGHEITKPLGFDYEVDVMILQHHERLDGSGYPYGVKDGQILDGSRILTVADVVESIMSHRPYRPSLGLDVAISEIQKNEGRYYDEKVVSACTNLFLIDGFKFTS